MYGGYTNIPNTFSRLLDLILPRRARMMRTLGRTEDDIPLRPASHHLLGTDITTLLDYRDPSVQDLIRSLKYDGSGHSAHICASILADFLQDEIAATKAFSPRKVLLVPMPLHTERMRERGFNQIGIILDRLPAPLRDGTHAILAPSVLRRTKATPQQAHLSRYDRIKNMRDAFEVSNDARIHDTHIFLIDDVTTTGATLASATKTLRKSGAQVTPIALARA